MKITKYLLFVFLLFYSFIHVQGQIPKSDSLWNEFRKAKHDTTKIKLYLEIGDIYEFQLPDTSIVYYQKAIALAEKSLVTSHSLSPIVATTIKKYLASSIRYIGIIYTNQGFYDKGIEFYLKALKISEELGDKKGVSRCYTSIGIVQYYQGNFEKSIGYFLKSINIDKGLGDKKGIAADYTNLGNVYSEMGTFDKALEYYIKSLKIAEELEDKIGMAQCYGNIAIIHEENGFFNKAMEYYQKSLKICEELGDKNGIAIELGNIASLHITLSDSVATTQGEKIKNYNKSINYGLKSLNLANEINAKFLINSAAGNLQKVYKALGNPAKALEYAEIYIATKDSMFNEDKTKALAEMETKYQSEKKQLEIEKLEKQRALDNETIARKEAETKKQRVIILFVICGLLFVVGFSLVLFNLFLQKKKANRKLAQQNIEIQQKNEEITTQRDEIKTQRNKLSNQNHLLAAQKQKITDSITYAKRIQQAVLPDLSLTLSKGEEKNSSIWGGLDEVFVLFKPKDIVSGDFYWASRVNEWLIVTVADCTGHGVPGAFMSMLGISFLNEIVSKKEVTQASQVLDQLRISIIDALKQKGLSGEQKDGMDIALVTINMKTLECQFAGANNSLYIVSNSKFQILNPGKQNSEGDKLCDKSSENAKPEISNLKPETNDQCIMTNNLLEIKGDKMPVSIYLNMKPFTNQSLQLNKGDILYLASDGYADQFGGQDNKKFKSKQIKKLLLANCDKPMSDQKKKLENTLTNWIGNREQIDDITLLGIKI